MWKVLSGVWQLSPWTADCEMQDVVLLNNTRIEMPLRWSWIEPQTWKHQNQSSEVPKSIKTLERIRNSEKHYQQCEALSPDWHLRNWCQGSPGKTSKWVRSLPA